jgi:hypothetical protein
MTEAKLERMRLFFLSLNYEIGFPCIHRELKNYIDDDDLTTWRQVHNRYLQFPLDYPVECDDEDDQQNGKDDVVIGAENENEEDEDQDDDEDEHDDDDNNDDDNAEQKDDSDQNYLITNNVVPKHTVIDSVLKGLSIARKKYYLLQTIRSFDTWFKYKRIYFSHISLQRLKEDCCDTCIKYKLQLEDPNLDEDERRDIITTLQVN